MGTEGIACLADWLQVLGELREEGLSPTTIRYSESEPGQRVLVPRLLRVDPALRAEAV
jgi:hypothetical protein